MGLGIAPINSGAGTYYRTPGTDLRPRDTFLGAVHLLNN